MTTWKSVHGASYGLHKKYRFDESSIYMEKDQPKVRQKLKPCFWYCDTVHMSWKMCQGNKVKDTSVKTMFLLLFWYLHAYKADNIFQWCLPCLQCKRFNVEQHLTLSPVSYWGPSFALWFLQQFWKIHFLQILAKTRVFANQGGLVRGQVEGFGDRCTLHNRPESQLDMLHHSSALHFRTLEQLQYSNSSVLCTLFHCFCNGMVCTNHQYTTECSSAKYHRTQHSTDSATLSLLLRWNVERVQARAKFGALQTLESKGSVCAKY